MGQGPFQSAIAKNPAGSWSPLVKDSNGALLVASNGALATLAGVNFRGANQAGDTLSAALDTTYVGICLSNPAASGKNLVLQRVAGIIDVAPAAGLALGLIGGYAAGGITVHTTPLVPRSGKLSVAGSPVAKLDSACTLVGTPAWIDWFVANAAAVGNPLNFSKEYDGQIVIPPGAYVAVGGSVAGPASGFFGSMEWSEVAI